MCEHKNVTVGYLADSGKQVWACQECGLEFKPVWPDEKEDEPRRATITVEALDAIAGTMSAVLWDYSERMAEKYGLQPQEPEEPNGDAECEPHVYDPATGKCRECGHNPFLGGQ